MPTKSPALGPQLGVKLALTEFKVLKLDARLAVFERVDYSGHFNGAVVDLIDAAGAPTHYTENESVTRFRSATGAELSLKIPNSKASVQVSGAWSQ